ncbi:MAG: transglutaminase domain-containing protein [Bacteroidales bacterium]|nr:transglutaminase domain-containing protein [Bacteroidales bacterium]
MNNFNRFTKAIIAIILTTILLPLSSAGQADAIWKPRADSITAGCKTSYEKAKAIYLWQVANIKYDYSMRIHSAKNCWRMRKGVCQAFSELFVNLANSCGVESRMIFGVAKTIQSPDGEGAHAWVEAKTERGTILIDPTWGACQYESDGNQTQLLVWFDVKPECMIFTHFPSDPKKQYLATPLTKKQYLDLPELNPLLVKRGWSASAVLSYFLKHPGEMAASIANGGYALENIQLIQAPYGRTLQIGKTYTFKIRCLKPGIVISSSEGKWVKDGNIYTLVLHPTREGWFTIGTDDVLGSFIRYDVVKSD